MIGAPIFLAGCTASGKSDVALALARRVGGEILAVDSMQVYRGLDIGTAKPTPSERAAVPQHLLDLAGPEEDFSAARWLEAAREASAEVQRRGRVPIFCGGTGFYFQAWFEGLNPGIGSDPILRRELEALPLDALLAELRDGDPATHAVVDRCNPRRVLRAVEILRLTGKPREPRPARPSPGVEDRIWTLRRDPADLRLRVNRRVDAMFASGLVEETRRALDQGLERNRTAGQAIGYRQVIEHLRGERDLVETVALVKIKTWQLARRQLTWWRRQAATTWWDVPADEAPDVTAAKLEDAMARATDAGRD